MIILTLTQGKVAIIDDIDCDLVNFKWLYHLSNRRKGYVKRHDSLNKNRNLRLHRVIIERKIGRKLLSTEFVDHINGDTLDNTRENLRLATYSQNAQNRKTTGSKTGYKGVFCNHTTQRWYARIIINGVRKYIGSYKTIEEAALAYDQKAIELFGEFATLNLSIDKRPAVAAPSHICQYCGIGFYSQKGVNAHLRFCLNKPPCPTAR